MSRTAKWLILSSAAVLVLGTLSTVLYGLWPYVYSGDIEKELAALRAAGKPVGLEDLVPPSIPKRENAALIYERAFDLLPKDTQPSYGRSAGGWYVPRNADYWRRARHDVEAAKDALALAAKAARMPKCAFSEAWWRGPQTRFQHISRLRFLAGLFETRATLHARSGQMSAAADDIRTTVLISRSIRSEPAMISALTQAAIVGTASRALAECLSYGTLASAQARELYDEFGRVNLKASFVSALEGERAVQLTVLDRIQERALPEASEDGGRIETLLRRWAGSPLLKAQIRMEKRAFLREMAAAISEADLSYRESAARRASGQSEKTYLRRSLITRSLVPSLDRPRAARDRGIAAAAGSRIVLALEAHRDQVGSYPDSLADLKSIPGWKIEKDPFSGRDFVYRKLPAGFLLYSIGEDFKDDGGSIDASPGQRASGSFGRRGDIVWRVER